MHLGKKLCGVTNCMFRVLSHTGTGRDVCEATQKNGWVLAYLASHEKEGKAVYQKDLEKEFNITRSTASKVISLMERKGLVERINSKEDARCKELRLTERAKEFGQRFAEEDSRMEEAMVRGFSEDELAKLHEYLDRIYENITAKGDEL